MSVRQYAGDAIMKFIINTEQCANGIQKAGNISPSKAGSAYLKTMWIKAEKNTVSFMTTDASTEYIGTYPADVQEEGLIGVSSRSISDLIRNLPFGLVTIKTDDKNDTIIISQGKRLYKLPSSSATWFQEFSPFPADNSVVWNGETLSEIIEKIFFCIDDSEESSWGCLCIKPDGEGGIVFCGLDGRKFAMVNIVNDELLQYLPADGIKIQKKYLSDIKKLISQGDIRLVIGEKRFYVRDNDFKGMFSIPLTDMSFIDYSSFLNRVHADGCSHLTVKKDDFLHALSRSAIFNTNTNGGVRLRITEDSLTISSEDDDKGSATETIAATCKSSISEIAFVTKSLIDILQHIPSDDVNITLSASLGPALFQPADDETYSIIAMPMQINDQTYYQEDDM